MSKTTKAWGFGIAVGAVGVLLVSGALVLLTVYTGAFNIAATEEHSAFVRWAFDTTFHRSVSARAADIQAPADLEAFAGRGAAEYKAMCQHCHGGPGVDRDEWASGLRPRPPYLTEAAAEWRPEEIFWLAKHGAKMTGMPAFGPTHDDETLWSIVALVKELPAMTPERYAELGEGHLDNQDHDHTGL